MPRSLSSKIPKRAIKSLKQSRTWYVYILRCVDGSLYTGITNNLTERVKKHNAGTGAKYTRAHRPVVLAWKRRASTATHARKREAAIKQMTKAEKEKLVA